MQSPGDVEYRAEFQTPKCTVDQQHGRDQAEVAEAADHEFLTRRLESRRPVRIEDQQLVQAEAGGHPGRREQIKFGQTTIARQDITRSVNEVESAAFLEKVKGIVRDIDPDGKNFRIEDTGLDIEIILTIDVDPMTGEIRDFDKGDGLEFICRELHIEKAKGPVLVCGDTSSDLPMLKKAMQLYDDVWAIFVTRDEKLMKNVREICPKSYMVPYPDILLTVLGLLSL